MSGKGETKGKEGGNFLMTLFSWMFLPQGFPDTVSDDYVPYQFWDTIQGLCAYLRGVLTTMATFKGLGIGNDQSSVEKAVIQWIIRDGIRMTARLCFGIPTLTDRFRSNIKVWRMASEVAVNCGALLELYALFEPSAFFNCVMVSSVFYAFSGVTGSCTRASLMTHFAKADNLGDCAAKESNQDAGVKMIGIGFAYCYLAYLSGNRERNVAVFLALSAAHLICNLLAVYSLKLPLSQQPHSHSD